MHLYSIMKRRCPECHSVVNRSNPIVADDTGEKKRQCRRGHFYPISQHGGCRECYKLAYAGKKEMETIMRAAHALSDPNLTIDAAAQIVKALSNLSNNEASKILHDDGIELWLPECTESVDPKLQANGECPKSGDLYTDYREWKKNRGERPVSHVRWSEPMQRRFEKVVSNYVRYRGLKLISPAPEDARSHS